MKQLLCLFLCTCLLLSGCAQTDVQGGLGNGWEPVSSMDLQFAHEFSVDYYADGYKLITLGDGSRYLTVPEGMDTPRGIAKDIVILQQPIDNIYLAATAAMCLFDSLDPVPRQRDGTSKAHAKPWKMARSCMPESTANRITNGFSQRTAALP